MTWTHWMQLVADHALIAYCAVFLAAFSESLAMVGLIIPGTTLMFAAGVVISTGGLMPLPVFLLAMLGAVAGDGVSYWLGHRYRDRLRRVWPLRRHPEMVSHGESFFIRYGGKSVFLGRFIGPIRPVIPMVAGMMGMGPLRFVAANLLSAVGWAVASLLPGVLFGTSLSVAGRISARLTLLMVVLLAAGWLFFLASRNLALFIGAAGPKWFEAIRSRAVASEVDTGWRRRARQFAHFLLENTRGERVLLPSLLVFLILGMWGFLGVLQDVLAGDPLVAVDQTVYHFLQSLRNPPADRVLVLITELGDGFVNIFVAGAVALVLLLSRRFRTLVYWLAVVAGGAMLVGALKYALHLPRPEAFYNGASAFGFPSGHTAMNITLYGFLAILLARELRNRVRAGLFAAVVTISSAVAFSRVYLGVHWLSDVLGGWLLGVSWISLAGIVYLGMDRKRSEPIPRRALAAAALCALAAAGAWRTSTRHARDMILYAPRRSIRVMSRSQWLQTGWRQASTWRTDVGGEREFPLDLQWAGRLDGVERSLTAAGWRRAHPVTVAGVLSMLAPNPSVSELPILPHLHLGRFEQRIFVRKDGDSRFVLRLWPTDLQLREGQTRIWAGNVSRQIKTQVVGWVTFARTGTDAAAALAALERDAADHILRKVRRLFSPQQHLPEGVQWDGTVLLMGPALPGRCRSGGR